MGISKRFLKRVVMWAIWNIPLGKVAPRLLAWCIGCNNWKKINMKGECDEGS
jgi:hypothetical protein